MINFRFHLVSLIAVFLALALGVLMGATVIDQAIVDGLNDRIASVRADARQQREENSGLREEIERLQRFVGDEFAVAGLLEGVPVPVFAPRGVNGDQARDAVRMLQTAGALAPGVLWVEEEWQLSDVEERRELADLLAVERQGADALRRTAWMRLGERLLAGAQALPEEEAASPEEEADGSTTDVLEALLEAELISFEPVGEQGDESDLATFAGIAARVLLIDQSNADADASAVIESATRGLAAAGLPQVLGEVYREEDDAPNRGVRLAVVREDDELIGVVSTIDDLELTEGKVATVWALADLGEGVVGHYGYADEADALLPAGFPR